MKPALRRWSFQPAVLAVALLFPFLALTLGGPDATRLLSETSLRDQPGGATLRALLTAGSPVNVLQERDGWLQVQVQGWIPAGALQEAVTPGPSHPGDQRPGRPAAPLPLTPPPATAPLATGPSPRVGDVPSAPGLPVEGTIALKLSRLRTQWGRGAMVLILPPTWSPETTGEEEAGVSADLARLEDEAARLKREAERAMRQDSFSDARETFDTLMGRRQVLLARRSEALAILHGRRQAAARSHALLATVADARGWFSFPSVAAGDYVLYARMANDEQDVEWVEKITVGPGSLHLDLDESGARDLYPDS
ncbi:MAG: hypothetical protein ACE5HD_07445 [Acidobacteriota bacterium]